MRLRISLSALLILVALWALHNAAQAAVFTVNSTADTDDGACDATHCTLREAINLANANPGLDTIAFNIPGLGPHTIQPTTTLPAIMGPVVMDGYTQPGSSRNTHPAGQGLNTVLMIELDGSNVGAGISGLTIGAGNSTVKGLVINRFSDAGIVLDTNGGNVISGNFIGTDVTGTQDLGNAGDGVLIDDVPDNQIGGANPEERNLISGNDDDGVDISFGGATGNVVQGNLIGTDVTGTQEVSNAGDGVLIDDAPDNQIGGANPGEGNTISGNDDDGVEISFTDATGNVVQGNFIGTDVTGTQTLGNGSDGVYIYDAPGNQIGGPNPREGNRISGNGASGVAIDGGVTGNVVQGNAIFSNAGLGVDLEDDDVTPNDAGDGDMGMNNLQNFPVLTSAITGTITIKGTLNSTPDTTFRLEFFANSTCDPSDHGEGETFLGPLDVTTDGGGDVNFTVTFANVVPTGHFVSATATDPEDNTSEFSRCKLVVACPDFQPPVGVDIGDVMAVAARWRLTAENPDPDNDPNTPNYEAQYDLIRDGIITILDIMTVVVHWGKTCS